MKKEKTKYIVVREKEIEQLIVNFTEADAGWISFTLTSGDQNYDGRFSVVWDPLIDFKHWLEAIAIGVQQTCFTFDAEGYYGKFDFENRAWNSTVLTISDLIDDKLKTEIEINVSRYQIVKAFYLGFLSFAGSSNFKSEEWEITCIHEKLCEFLKVDKKKLIEMLLDLSGQELGKVLFNVHPTYTVSFPTAKTSEEIMQLYLDTVYLNKELPKEHSMVETPDFYNIPNDYDYWQTDRKKELILEYINDKVSGYSGTKIDEFRSKIVEKYLEKEVSD